MTEVGAFDATGYYFPGYPAVPPNDYIDGLKKKAADRVGPGQPSRR